MKINFNLSNIVIDYRTFTAKSVLDKYNGAKLVITQRKHNDADTGFSFREYYCENNLIVRVFENGDCFLSSNKIKVGFTNSVKFQNETVFN